jgi:hypothetical protein
MGNEGGRERRPIPCNLGELNANSGLKIGCASVVSRPSHLERQRAGLHARV